MRGLVGLKLLGEHFGFVTSNEGNVFLPISSKRIDDFNILRNSSHKAENKYKGMCSSSSLKPTKPRMHSETRPFARHPFMNTVYSVVIRLQMKRLGVFPLPLDGILGHRRLLASIL